MSRWIAVLALAALGACGVESESAAGPSPTPKAVAEDAELASWRLDLLATAFDVASMYPIDPHVKSRARAQEQVVEACLELDRPQQALRYLKGIGNWRRGLAYAELAHHLAAKGDGPELRRYMQFALDAAREMGRDASVEEWRVDRIRAAVAKAHLRLGETEEALKIGTGLVPSEQRTFDVAIRKTLRREDLGVFHDMAAQVLRGGSLEQIQGVLTSAADLYETHFDDAEERDRLARLVENPEAKVPVGIRVDLMMRIAGVAHAKGDEARAAALAARARELVEAQRWRAEDKTSFLARLAVLKAEMGDPKGAREQLDRALEWFEERRDAVVDIYRARALRPLAEAHQAIGDADGARRVYRRALEEGRVNPNSRPRADDLVATLCSMILHDVEPDARVSEEIEKAYAGLGEPW